MKKPSLIQGETVKRLIQGAVVGAAATMIIGFSWGGWMFGGAAESQAAESARSAIVSSLAPICADNFRNSDDVSMNLAALKEITGFKRAGFVEEGGWATLPGSDEPAAGVARACAELLL